MRYQAALRPADREYTGLYPSRMDERAFTRLVAEALQELPPWAAAALDNVAVIVAGEDPDDPDLYGVYDGTALPDRVGDAHDEPARILVYRLPLVADFPERGALRREVRITVLHEVAHHFGLDEDRLEDLGYG